MKLIDSMNEFGSYFWDNKDWPSFILTSLDQSLIRSLFVAYELFCDYFIASSKLYRNMK